MKIMFIASSVIIIITVIFMLITIIKLVKDVISNISLFRNIFTKVVSSSDTSDVPKSLPNLEKVLLKKIEKDFDNLDIDLFKGKVIIEFEKILKNEKIKTNEKVKKQINNKYTHISNIHFNNIVICNYNKYYSILDYAISFSYYKNDNKVEDKIILEYKLNKKIDYKSNCPNCGAPVENNKICKYCKSPLNVNQNWELYKIRK